MYKIGVIGDKDSVLGFMAVGFTVFVADDAPSAASALRAAAREGYAAVFITEEVAKLIPDEIDRYRSTPLPAVTLIPGKSGSEGLGFANLKKSVECAVGVDILFKESS